MNLAAIFVFSTTVLGATAPAGIPRELAIQRASEVSDLRYQLSYALIPHADDTTAHEELRFRLNRAVPLWIDFREGTISKVVLNGTVLTATTIENGHFLLPESVLHASENTLSVDFTAPVAAAGKALTRFEDKDDGSEYIYTLFVPMDADMAFPCFDQPDLKGKFTLQVSTPFDWRVISNAEGGAGVVAGTTIRYFFGETRPISTYLFAFAAGPFQNVHPALGLPNVWV